MVGEYNRDVFERLKARLMSGAPDVENSSRPDTSADDVALNRTEQTINKNSICLVSDDYGPLRFSWRRWTRSKTAKKIFCNASSRSILQKKRVHDPHCLPSGLVVIP